MINIRSPNPKILEMLFIFAGRLASKRQSSFEGFIASLQSRSLHIKQSGTGVWKYSIKIKSVKSDSWFCLLNAAFIFLEVAGLFFSLLIWELNFLSAFYPSKETFQRRLFRSLNQLTSHFLGLNVSITNHVNERGTPYLFVCLFVFRFLNEPQLEEGWGRMD